MTSPPHGRIPDRPHERLAQVGDATQRLVRAVDALDDGAWSEDSLLPGWSRAHVVAHLTLNAEGVGRALRGLVSDGERRPMYDSDAQRDTDIAELAAADPTEIRDRFLASTTTFANAASHLPDDRWNERIERTPGGRDFAAGAAPGMRWGEVEIHHADLGIGYTADDWALDFAEHELRAMARREEPPQPFEVRPTDSNEVYVFGAGDDDDDVAIVTGPSAHLAWWLTGRPASDQVSSSRGELPPIRKW